MPKLADIELDDFSQRDAPTALELAIREGKWRAVPTLIAANADLEHENERGQTPLRVAAQYKRNIITIALMKAGADWKRVQVQAAQSRPIAVFLNQKIKMIKTWLMDAVRTGDIKTLGAMLTHSSAIFKQFYGLSTELLALAAKRDKLEAAELLLQAGARTYRRGNYFSLSNLINCWIDCDGDFNTTYNNGETPLYRAAVRGETDVITYLLSKGASFEDAFLLLIKRIRRTPGFLFHSAVLLLGIYLNGKENPDAVIASLSTSLPNENESDILAAITKEVKNSTSADIIQAERVASRSLPNSDYDILQAVINSPSMVARGLLRSRKGDHVDINVYDNAAITGNTDLMYDLLEYGVNLDMLLLLSARNESAPSIELILKQGIEIKPAYAKLLHKFLYDAAKFLLRTYLSGKGEGARVAFLADYLFECVARNSDGDLGALLLAEPGITGATIEKTMSIANEKGLTQVAALLRQHQRDLKHSTPALQKRLIDAVFSSKGTFLFRAANIGAWCKQGANPNMHTNKGTFLSHYDSTSTLFVRAITNSGWKIHELLQHNIDPDFGNQAEGALEYALFEHRKASCYMYDMPSVAPVVSILLGAFQYTIKCLECKLKRVRWAISYYDDYFSDGQDIEDERTCTGGPPHYIDPFITTLLENAIAKRKGQAMPVSSSLTKGLRLGASNDGSGAEKTANSPCQ